MNRYTFCRHEKMLRSVFFALVLTGVAHGYAEVVKEVVLTEDFSKGLGRWITEGHKVKIYRGEDNKCAMIQRRNTKDSAFLKWSFKGYEGDLVFKARIKVENFEQGEEDYHNVKFQARRLSNNVFKGYDSHNLEADTDWAEFTFDVNGVKQGDETILMIGLENAAGIVYVDDIEVTNVRLE
ncbi:MAG: hypothetical protein EOM20_08405 [Spartobacteria bacterium]|nr:hypothetical protein [Spartobacteria bacterium]